MCYSAMGSEPTKSLLFEQCVNDGDLWCVLLKLVIMYHCCYCNSLHIYIISTCIYISTIYQIYLHYRLYIYMLKQHMFLVPLDFPKDFSPSLLCAARERRGEAINDVFGPSKLEKSPMQKAAFHGEWR